LQLGNFGAQQAAGEIRELLGIILAGNDGR
jgi:hypothetical protein